MTKLTKSEVEHIGKLANLDLTQNESEKFGRELTEILDFVGKLSSVDTTQVSPLNNVTGKKNIFREDEVKASLSQKQALANAPSVYKGYFKIKAIFER